MFGQQPSQNTGMQVTRGGLSPQEEYLRWAWGQGTGASGGLGPLPLFAQGVGQNTGRSFGPGAAANGFTPEFAAQINQLLFPNVRPGFQTVNANSQTDSLGGNFLANLTDLASMLSPQQQQLLTKPGVDPRAFYQQYNGIIR